MKRVIGLISGLIVMIGCVKGQGVNTIFQPTHTNVVVTGAVNVRNVGQSFHLITVTAGDIGVGSCTGPLYWTGRIQIEGSFDNITWIRIGQPVLQLGVDYPVITSGIGAFPYIRVNYSRGRTADCKLSATYSGNLYGQKLSDVYDNRVRTGMVNASGTGAVPGVTILGNCPIADGITLSVYSIIISNTGAADATGINLSTVDNTPVTVETMNLGVLASKDKIVIPIGSRPYLGANQFTSFTPPVDLELSFAGATTLSYYVQYRCE